jgi:hypothetical protein
LDRIISESSNEKTEELISKALDMPVARGKIIKAGIKAKDTLLVDDKEYL